VQRAPNFLLESQISRTGDGFNVSSDVYQTWQKSGSCPEETVPIRRIRKEDLLRAVSLARFGQKPPEVFVINSINPTNLNFSNLNANDGVVDLKNRSVHIISNLVICRCVFVCESEINIVLHINGYMGV
jgi:hypothetical protein